MSSTAHAIEALKGLISILTGDAKGFGCRINISTALVTLGLWFRGECAIAKSAISGSTRSLMVKVARAGVTVNADAPGYTLTETLRARQDSCMLDCSTYAGRAPAGAWGLGEEIGHLIAWLALPAYGFVTGTIIAGDGGYTIRGDPGEAIGLIAPAAALDAVRKVFTMLGRVNS